MANLMALRRSPVTAPSEGLQLSENEFWGKKLLRAIGSQQLKIAEQTAFWGTLVAGAVAVSQQTMVAIPLSLCCGLSVINRRRFEEVLQQRLATTTVEIAAVSTMENRLDAIAIGSIQERILTLEKAQLQQQITQLQQWVTDLDDRLEELGDRDLKLEQVQQQLAAIQKSTSAPTQKGRGRVAIFIDGANLFYAIQELGIRIDYTKLLALLVGKDTLFRAVYYTGAEAADEKQRGFFLWLRHHGFRVVSKPVLQRPDGSKKANLDVEMAMDIVSLAGQYDTVVLVSGDGDLACALHQVSAQSARVEVVSLRSMTSEALIDVADSYVNLEEIQDKVCKTQ